MNIFIPDSIILLLFVVVFGLVLWRFEATRKRVVRTTIKKPRKSQRMYQGELS